MRGSTGHNKTRDTDHSSREEEAALAKIEGSLRARKYTTTSNQNMQQATHKLGELVRVQWLSSIVAAAAAAACLTGQGL